MSTNIPPGGGRPASTPPSKRRDEGPESGRRKEFKLPKKSQEKEEEKRKTPYELMGNKAQDAQVAIKTPGEEALAKVSPLEAKMTITQIAQAIRQLVERMHIGQVDGKSFASLSLKESRDLPPPFSGSQLTVHDDGTAGLTIRFDQFATPQHQNDAIYLVEQNKQQLEQMIASLQAKQIQIKELFVGSYQVALPRVEPLPPPFRTEPANQGTLRDRERSPEQEPENREDAF